jgi:hypothetical protein
MNACRVYAGMLVCRMFGSLGSAVRMSLVVITTACIGYVDICKPLPVLSLQECTRELEIGTSQQAIVLCR